MRKVFAMLGLLIALIATVAIVEPFMTGGHAFISPQNIRNVSTWTGLYGILAIGEAFVIITAGIDLSVGAIVGLAGILAAMFMRDFHVSAAIVIPAVLAFSAGLGLIHGLLITKMRMQPFVVTLCGLLIYRGVTRFVAGDMTKGFGLGYHGLKFMARGIVPVIGVPMPLLLMLGIGIIASVFLHMSVYGRHLFALGRNENAARYSGVHVDRMVIVAYVISAFLAGFSGLLFALNVNSLQPSNFGSFYELYAIAAAVLGGCSLRGGEGTIIGVIIGTAVLRVLPNLVNLLGIKSELEFAVVGGVILLGVLADEFLRKQSERRQMARPA